MAKLQPKKVVCANCRGQFEIPGNQSAHGDRFCPKCKASPPACAVEGCPEHLTPFRKARGLIFCEKHSKA